MNFPGAGFSDTIEPQSNTPAITAPPHPSSASRLHQQALHTSTLRKSRSIPVHLTVAGEEESSALPFRLRPEAYRGYTEHDPDCELIQEVSSNHLP